MPPTTMHVRAGLAAVAGSLLLLADLLLGWHRTEIGVPGAVAVQATDSGWEGWGLVAGALAIVVAVVMVRELRGHDGHPVAALVAGFGVLLAVALAALASSVDISVAGQAGIEVHAVRWPASAGLGLGAFVAISCVAAFTSRPGVSFPAPTRRTNDPHAHVA